MSCGVGQLTACNYVLFRTQFGNSKWNLESELWEHDEVSKKGQSEADKSEEAEQRISLKKSVFHMSIVFVRAKYEKWPSELLCFGLINMQLLLNIFSFGT